MVVVAIIAILSTIAIPSYQSFQAKARQKEGLSLLSSYYTSAHASRAELGGFPGNFVLTGFSPSGELGYQLNAADTGIVPTYAGFSNDAACIDTLDATLCNCGGMCAQFKQWRQPVGRQGVVGGMIGWIAPMAGVATAQTFTIFTAGVIETRSASQDEWSMNELKQLTQITDGSK